MEDKELQELFAAKRTVEANRRRQEKLAAMIGRKATHGSRRIWPLWAVSAAAGVAALLMTTPSLFRYEATEPQLVALARDGGRESLENSEGTRRELGGNSEGTRRELGADSERTRSGFVSDEARMTGIVGKNGMTKKTRETGVSVAEEEDVLTATGEDTQPEGEVDPLQPAPQPQQPQTQPQRRVHRRTSTRMVSTDNTTKAVKRDYRKVVADAICQEKSNTITLHTIELS